MDCLRTNAHWYVAVLMMLAAFGSKAQEAQSAAPVAVPTAVTEGAAAGPDWSQPEALGDLYMAQHRYVAALAVYQGIPAKSAVMWNKIGVAYHHMFAFEEARKNYELALKLNPHYAEALNNLGAVYHSKKDFRQAQHEYKLAIKYAPKSGVAYGNLGTTYFASHKYKQGIRAYQKAMEVDPTIFSPGRAASIEEGVTAEQRIAVNYSLAKVYAQAGKQSEAIAALHKALDAGFKDRRKLMEDRELASLRETPEFKQMVMDLHLR